MLLKAWPIFALRTRFDSQKQQYEWCVHRHFDSTIIIASLTPSVVRDMAVAGLHPFAHVWHVCLDRLSEWSSLDAYLDAYEAEITGED